MSEYNFYDDRHCINCANAKFRETFQFQGQTKELYYCGLHRQLVTDCTWVQIISGCKGRDYVSRVGAKPKKKAAPIETEHQITLDEWFDEVTV